MAKQVINNGESGLIVRGKINDNFTELYTGKDSVTVNTYADLPSPVGLAGEKWWVLTSTGVYLINRRNAGSYYSDGAVWTWLGNNPTTADQIGNVPAGGISATDVQAALNGLDTGKLAIAGTAVAATVLATNRTIAMTGDVTWNSGNFNGSANVTAAGTIANDAVTFAKMQNSTAASVLVGRGQGSGAGDFIEITLGTNLSMTAGVLNASGGSGSGDVVGPASATDNAIARYDTATGKLLQNSAATVSDDGIIRSATNSGANPVSVGLVNWVELTADYNLSNVATEQQIFNTTTNGALTLPTGAYQFECFFYITTMNAASGNAAFDPIGAGTAVADRFGYDASGIDAGAALTAGTVTGSGSVTQQSAASVVTAGTGTGMRARVTGRFRITTSGTIIPSITLVTANAAVMKAGTYFIITKIGESSETYVGAWT